MAETSGNLDEALALYERNTRLSESFYTPLQSLEVCLRNTLDRCMREHYGADWLRPGHAPLAAGAATMIVEANRVFQGHEAAADAVVAELKFAFWVSLLAPRYDATLWRRASTRRSCKDRPESAATSTGV